MPVLRPLTIDEEEALWEKYFRNNTSRLAYYRTMKELRKSTYVSKNALLNLKDGLTYFSIFQRHFDGPPLLLDREARKFSNRRRLEKQQK